MIEKLLAGKYKGVSFLVSDETINNIGQKRIRHDYPNSSYRYSESQGKSPFDCTLNIFFKGDSFQDDFKAFQRVIEDPSPGRLYLPTFGVFNNIVADPSPAKANMTTIGEITMSVNFTETIEKPSPITTLASEEDVNAAGETARRQLQDAFAANYAPPSTVNNAKTSQSDITKAATTLFNITKELAPFALFMANITVNSKSPQDFARALLSNSTVQGYLQKIAILLVGDKAFSQFKSLAVVGYDLSNSMADITNGIFPKNLVKNTVTNYIIPLWEENTAERKERNNNRLSTINTFRTTGLIGMMEQSASKVYTTTDDVDTTKKSLDDTYNFLVSNDTTGKIIPDMKPSLDNLYGLSKKVLESKRQQSFNVSEMTLEKTVSAANLAYDLYGEYVKNDQQLAYMAGLVSNLNRSQCSNLLSGLVKVVKIG